MNEAFADKPNFRGIYMPLDSNDMMNPYVNCPVYENENYVLRMVKKQDAEDLLKVYSDENAVPLFNSDNCGGDDFRYTTESRMKKAIEYWIWEYNRQGFVRWAVFSKVADGAIGTIEFFNRKADDYFNNCGILRLDLRSDYEQEEKIFEILPLFIPSAFDLFNCQMIATKIPSFASERKMAVSRLNFVATEETLIGHDKTIYTDYFVVRK